MEHSTARVAIITGASRGIGAGLVDAYCKIGYEVIANSRAITDTGRPEIFTVAGDIADPETAERLVEGAVSRFGHIDTLINNAITRRVICRMLTQGGTIHRSVGADRAVQGRPRRGHQVTGR